MTIKKMAGLAKRFIESDISASKFLDIEYKKKLKEDMVSGDVQTTSDTPELTKPLMTDKEDKDDLDIVNISNPDQVLKEDISDDLGLYKGMETIYDYSKLDKSDTDKIEFLKRKGYSPDKILSSLINNWGKNYLTLKAIEDYIKFRMKEDIDATSVSDVDSIADEVDGVNLSPSDKEEILNGNEPIGFDDTEFKEDLDNIEIEPVETQLEPDMDMDADDGVCPECGLEDEFCVCNPYEDEDEVIEEYGIVEDIEETPLQESDTLSLVKMGDGKYGFVGAIDYDQKELTQSFDDYDIAVQTAKKYGIFNYDTGRRFESTKKKLNESFNTIDDIKSLDGNSLNDDEYYQLRHSPFVKSISLTGKDDFFTRVILNDKSEILINLQESKLSEAFNPNWEFQEYYRNIRIRKDAYGIYVYDWYNERHPMALSSRNIDDVKKNIDLFLDSKKAYVTDNKLAINAGKLSENYYYDAVREDSNEETFKGSWEEIKSFLIKNYTKYTRVFFVNPDTKMDSVIDLTKIGLNWLTNANAEDIERVSVR